MGSTPQYKYIRIIARDNKAKYGTIDFSDPLYIYNARVKSVTNDIKLLETEENLTSISNINETRHHLVQTQSYRKFLVAFNVTELVDYTTFQSSNEITLIDENRQYYDCRDCEISEADDGSGGKEIKLTATVLADDSRAVSEFVTNAYLFEKYDAESLEYKCASLILGNDFNIDGSDVDFENGKTVRYYTKFKQIRDRSDPNTEEIVRDNDSKTIVNVKDFETYSIILYLTEDERENFKKHYLRCHKNKLNTIHSGSYIEITEPLEVEFPERPELLNLYKVVVTIKLNVMNTYKQEFNKWEYE